MLGAPQHDLGSSPPHDRPRSSSDDREELPALLVGDLSHCDELGHASLCATCGSVVNAPLERCRSRHGRQLPYVLRDRGSHRRAHQRHLTRKSPPIRTYGWRLPRASPTNPGRTAWHDWQFVLSPPSKRLLRPPNAWPTGGATRPCRTHPVPGSLGRVETGERTRLTVSARASVRCRRRPRGGRR